MSHLHQLDESALSRLARNADLAAHTTDDIETYARLIAKRDALRAEQRRRLVIACINLGAGGGL